MDLPGFRGDLRNTSRGTASLEARQGGAVRLPNVTALHDIDLTLRDSSEISISQLKAITKANCAS